MAEMRRCVHCDAVFEVNWRAAGAQQWCGAATCQRERRRRAQRARRAKVRADERQPRSTAAKRAHAAYMAAYRARDPGYRERERVARKRLRAAARDRARAVSEAGSTDAAAAVYVDEDAEGGTRLRVVTRTGRVLLFLVDDRGSPRSVDSRASSAGDKGAPGVSAVSEAG